MPYFLQGINDIIIKLNQVLLLHVHFVLGVFPRLFSSILVCLHRFSDHTCNHVGGNQMCAFVIRASQTVPVI